MPQLPTTRGIKIRSAADAHLLFYAVHLQRLPIIQRRLDATERAEVVSGAVFIWEERSAATPQANGNVKGEPDAGPPSGVISGIERWTDGLKWGPSRVRDDFLFYQEKDSNDRDTALTPPPPNSQSLYRTHSGKHSDRLVKQTYSVHYHPQVLEGRPPVEPARKWHLTAYHSPSSIDRLADVTSIPELTGIVPPEGLFKKARVGKKRDNPPSGNHNTSSSHGAAIAVPNVAGGRELSRAEPGRGEIKLGSVPSPEYGNVGNGNVYGMGNGVNSGGVIGGGYGTFGNGMDMPPPHPHHHGHHASSGSSGYVNHARHSSMEAGAPHLGHHVQPPQPSQNQTRYPLQPSYPLSSSSYDPRYGANGTQPHSHGHSHSHSGSVGYGNSYGQPSYGGEYAGNDYGYDRGRPFSAGRMAPQLAPSGISNASYDPTRPPPPPAQQQQQPNPPPISQLHQHHRSHSHGYSNGHAHPGSQHGTPLVQYTRPEPHSFSTPMQQHAIPQSSPEHQRGYSNSSDVNGNGLRSPGGSGAVRTRRGINGNRSDDSAPLSTSPPVDSGRNHFSPYSRPGNAPGPRQHSAFVPPPSNRRAGTASGAGFDNGYGSGHFTGEHPYQPPGMPIAHSRSQSLPQPYPTPSIPPPPMNSTSLYPSQPPSDTVTQNQTNGVGAGSQYGTGHGETSPFRPIDYSTTVPSTSWAHATLPSPVASLQSQSAFPYPAGSFPSTTTQTSPHLAHAHAGGHTIVSGDLSGGSDLSTTSNGSYPSHLAPHLNPNASPPMTHFRAPSTSFGSGGSGSPELARQSYSGGAGAEFSTDLIDSFGTVVTANIGPFDGGVGIVGKSNRKASLPPALDTSITGSSSAPTSASSKLVPLTPLAHPARDPEDERVLDLLSRSGGGRGSGDAGSVTSGIGAGLGEDGEGKGDE